jgi:hypothetical protein
MSCKVVSICEGACTSFRNRMDAFRRDELPPEAMRLLLRHVLGCRRCLEELRCRQPSGLRGEIPPPELAHRILDRIRVEAERVTSQRDPMKNPVSEGV